MIRMYVGNITEDAGAALLNHAGAKKAGAAEIKANAAELLAASREVDGHALTLNLLGRFLARAHSGDIRRRDLVKFEDADRKEQGGSTFKMLTAFENWFARSGEFGERQLAVLRILGLFDRPADAGCIGALRKPPVIVGLTDPLFTTRLDTSTGQPTVQPLLDEDWNTATSFLADFGLLVIQADANNTECLLDCHPLIREHFARALAGLAPEAWRSAHNRLFEHLKGDTRDMAQPSLDDLQPLYQAVVHGCSAGLFSRAINDVYKVRILRLDLSSPAEFYSWKQLGAFSSDLSVIARFFSRPWTEVVAERRVMWEEGWLLNEAAVHLRALGRLSEASEALLRAFGLGVAHRDWTNAARRAINHSEIMLILGATSKSISDAEAVIAVAYLAALP